MTREEAMKAVKKHGGQRAAARALGICRTTIARALRRSERVSDDARRDESSSGKKTLTIEEALRPLDVLQQVVEVVRAIPAGQVMTDEQLRRECEIGSARWRRVRGSARLAGHHCTLPTGTMWGSKGTIKTLQERYKEML